MQCHLSLRCHRFKRLFNYALKGVFAIKFTLLITQRCNLACAYCYVTKKPASMAMGTAEKVIDFVFGKARKGEKNHIGFFGGEPLLEFGLLRQIMEAFERHPSFSQFEMDFNVVSNGTIFSDEIADYLLAHRICYCLSCDGGSSAQDAFRRFPDGGGTSHIVGETIRKAMARLPLVLVNAVYTPRTLPLLPDTVRYFMGHGLRQIYLSADYSAPWQPQHIPTLDSVLAQLADIYIDSYRKGRPVYISMLDDKIAVILRGGYRPEERCQMGIKELAFTPDGDIFPCERLVYGGDPASGHCIGHIDTGIDLSRLNCHIRAEGGSNDGGSGNDGSGNDGDNGNPCLACSIRQYCLNWCGCSNFHATGYYNRAGAYLCAEEKASIRTAFQVMETLEGEMPGVFSAHAAGLTSLNIWRY